MAVAFFEERFLNKVIVRNKTRHRLLGDAIERADTSQTRRMGLLKRTGLAKGEGLWILPCEGIHTFFMKFPIDVLFLNRKKQVVKALPSLGPWRLAMSLRGRSVLELPAGTIRDTGTQRGDQIEIVERDVEQS
ncbi:MAG TPA: DUF192 domain-containing protein [Bryobacterales bacterium]|nr:DUF192 domain-containing protein [Bryobacterales bacterium]